MSRWVRSSSHSHRGAILIGTLFLVLIATTLVIGIMSFALAHNKRAYVDADNASAMMVAEAGINYELRSLTVNSSAHIGSSPAVVTVGTSPWQGSTTVYCTNTDGSALASSTSLPSSLIILASGTVGSVTRKVQIVAKCGAGNYNYGVYSKKSGTINGSQTIVGSVGTSGSVVINGSNSISDTVIGLHGSSATATINPAGKYTTQVRADLTWPTVSDVANNMFPSGGQTYLQSTNDNGLSSAYVTSGILNGSIYSGKTVSPAIVSSAISANGSGTITFTGKAGGANYYLNNMTLNGTWLVTFNNTAGPINIWCVGKNGGSGSFILNGGNASVKMTDDATKAVKVYVSDKCNLTLNGNGSGYYGVYAINDSTSGGNVTLNGSNHLYGAVVANSYTFNGVNTVTAVSGYFSAGTGSWSYDSGWLEVNPR